MFYDAVMHELWGASNLPREGKKLFSPSNSGSCIFENYFLVDNESNISIPVYILPDLSAHLIIHEFIHDEKLSLNIIGPRSKGFLINRKNRKRTFIARFKPGVLFSILGIPANEIKDLSIPLESIINFKPENIHLQYFLKNEISVEQLFYKVEQLILNYFSQKNNSYILCFLKEIKNSKSIDNVHQTAQKMGISNRHLQKICNKHIGLTPKEILRVERFTRTIINRIKPNHYNWTDIAHITGYTDQSHLIAEYQQLIGRTPFQLFS